MKALTYQAVLAVSQRGSPFRSGPHFRLESLQIRLANGGLVSKSQSQSFSFSLIFSFDFLVPFLTHYSFLLALNILLPRVYGDFYWVWSN